MVVGVQEVEWEGEKAVPFFFFFFSLRIHSSAAPTPQSSVRQHTLHKLLLTNQSITQQLFTRFVRHLLQF